MTDRDYQAIPGIRWSRLRHMLVLVGPPMVVSPKRYKHACDAKESPDTDARLLGRAIHCATLEPDSYEERYTWWTGKAKWDKRTKACKEFLAAAAASGKELISPAQHRAAMACALAIRRHPAAMRYLSGAKEAMFTWTDRETGLPCKMRLDLLTQRRLLDVKSSSRGVDPRSFGRWTAAYSYHAQLAFYFDGLKANGFELQDPMIIAVESGAPHDVVVHEVGKLVIDAGREIYSKLLFEVRAGLEREAQGDPDPWPGIAPRFPVPLELPAYAMPEPELDMEGVEGFDGGE